MQPDRDQKWPNEGFERIGGNLEERAEIIQNSIFPLPTHFEGEMQLN